MATLFCCSAKKQTKKKTTALNSAVQYMAKYLATMPAHHVGSAFPAYLITIQPLTAKNYKPRSQLTQVPSDAASVDEHARWRWIVTSFALLIDHKHWVALCQTSAEPIACRHGAWQLSKTGGFLNLTGSTNQKALSLLGRTLMGSGCNYTSLGRSTLL